MENKLTKDDEAVIAFLAWSNGESIDDISQEMIDALYPTVRQLPESSKRMCYRMEGVLQAVLKSPDLSNAIWSENEDVQKEYFLSLGESFVKNLNTNEELKKLYLDFAKTCVDLRYGENISEKIQDQMKLIVSKETN
jgi:predicted hydrocarbon binding protein